MKTIEYKINTLEDVRSISESYRKGVIKLNISELSRELKISRKTIRKHLNGSYGKEKAKRKKYLDDYKELIISILDDEYQEFLYIDHLYKYLKREHGIKCSRSTFNSYVQNDEELKCKFKKNKSKSFTVRFETESGQQAQFDLKEKVKIVYYTGEVVRVNVATLTFGYSRYNYRKILLTTSFEAVTQFLAECFELSGGAPKELVIDNIKSLVDKPRTKTKGAILNAKFIEFLKDFNIECKPCMPYRPQTKGKTETQNKIPSQLTNYNGKYKSIEDVSEKLSIINNEDNTSVSQVTKLPRILLFNKEKGDMNPLPTKAIRVKYHLTLNTVKVSNESLISYKGCKYSVPKLYLHKKVQLVVSSNSTLHIYYDNKIIAHHVISNNPLNIDVKHNLIYKEQTDFSSKDENAFTSNKYIKKELESIKYD